MSSEDHQNTEVPTEEYVEEGNSFDELAKGIASGALSRGQLIKLAGAAVLGSVLSGALPGVAVAKKKKKKKKKHHHRPPAPILSPPSPPPPPTCNTGEALCGTEAAATCCATDPNTGCGCFPEVGGQPVCLATNVTCSTPCSVPSDCPTGSTCADVGIGQNFCTCASNSDCPNSSVCAPIPSGPKLCFPLCTNGVPNFC